MPTITLNKDVFEKLVGKKLAPDKLKDRISYLGTDLEKIEGNEIHVEVFPDRPDMLSEQGFARAFSSFIGEKRGLRKYDVMDSGEKVIIEKSVNSVRPYTTCAIVKGLKFNDEKIREIIQIQEKLHITFCRNRKKAAIGIYPSEKIKYPITYLARKPEDIKFRPLEFPREINGKQILSQHSAGRDYGYLLEGLDKYPIFIDANDNILSVPPIINSHMTGKITEKTTDVFIECSGFDFEAQNELLNILVTALAEMGGQVYSMKLEYPDKKIVTPDLAPKKMKLDLPYVNKWLGLELKDAEAKKLLERMGFGYEKGTVLIPAYRADILHLVDIAEDIAIAYGYENFKEEIPKVATIGVENKLDYFKTKIARILVGLGLLEMNSYNITNREWQTKNMNSKIKVIELVNALTKEFDVMRTWMIPSMLHILEENKHHEYPQKIFEIGTVFKKDKTGKAETGIIENERLCIALCHATSGFTEIKQAMDYLFNTIDVKYDIKDVEHESFIPGRVGRVTVNGKDVAYIGELHPSVLENWDLNYPVAVLELNVSELFEVLNK